MRFSRFFIDRPIFAAVVSIVIFIAGLIAMFGLPISEYPEVVPPSVVVRAIYPGANPRVISEAVATPLEEQINGVENMLYMSSQSTSDGVLTLTVTFRVGTDPDLAQVQVQNRVSQALPRLPEEVRQLGVTTVKSSPNFIMVVHLLSPDNRYDVTYLRNYGLLQVKDVLARIPGIGQVQVFGGGDYAMRVWLDPGKVAARGLSATDVVNAIREQNVQVAAGVVGAPPMPVPVDYQLSINARGRLANEEEFGDIILKTGDNGEITRLRDVARLELAAGDYALRSLLNGKEAVGIGIFQAPGSNALQLSSTVRATMEELKAELPPGRGLPDRLRSHDQRARRDPRGGEDAVRGHPAGGAGRGAVPPDLAGLGHSAGGGPGLHRRHLRHPADVRLLHQHPLAVRAGAGHRHRGGRCHRGGGERGAEHRGGPLTARRRPQGDGRGEPADHRDHAGALRRVRAGGIPERSDRRVLPPVRAHDRVLHRDLGDQLADPVAGPECHSAEAARCRARPSHPLAGPRAAAGCSGPSIVHSAAAPRATARP